ncbi:mannitol dehydrogenase family protein [Oceanispirochaeta sp.]|jgi:mannitol 2-dehydrogenase|uniref:mannitol dehydrogenase family protein n=1 Tax=Oceanispirochaeta sp. TaxID=2035350 RepID=UPI00261C59B3|nr:mannitol dehydrogenase family protein [Oceanispirochaeta sp.]MDA3955645.1 mannitol dehydrogenase family protein [Oceanispirochaeta sp.]
METLSNTLKFNKKSPLLPRLDRSKMTSSIVHIGVGNFHRSHQETFFQRYMEETGQVDLGIYGISVRDNDKPLAQLLNSQDCLYTVLEQSDSDEPRDYLISSLLNYKILSESCKQIIEKLSDPATTLVTLTVTEGGYNFNDSTGEFQILNPDIQHDIVHTAEPKTFYGLLYEALKSRRAKGISPFDLLSCDNVEKNGEILKKGLLTFASQISNEMKEWIEQNVAFPCSMVDRITPLTSKQDKEYIKEEYSYIDNCPVPCEPFILWVIEDHFNNARPDLDKLDNVYFVEDVSPHEKMKMRLLNAGHVTFAHMALYEGLEYSSDFMTTYPFDRAVEKMMREEALPFVGEVPDFDVIGFLNNTIKRFRNPKIKDQTLRLATDTSNRITKFVLPTIEDSIRSIDQAPPLLTLGVAGWCHALSEGQEFSDPLRESLVEAAQKAVKTEGREFILAFPEIFTETLRESSVFMEVFEESLILICENGPARAISMTLERHYS